jgi:DNA-binding response OmpR family regulator
VWVDDASPRGSSLSRTAALPEGNSSQSGVGTTVAQADGWRHDVSEALEIVAVEPEPRLAKEMAEAFQHADFCFRAVSDARRLLAAIRSKRPHAVLVHAEVGSSPLVDVLQALLHDPALARLPVFVVCLNTTDESLVAQARTGVVALLHEPFSAFEHPAVVRAVLAELPERTGMVVGFEGARMVDHIQQTLRSGALKVNPGHPHESQAFFANGVLRWARHQSASGMTALGAMLALPRTPWAFVELGGQQGEGAGFVIELPDRPTSQPTSAAPHEAAELAIDVDLDGFVDEEPPLAAGVLADEGPSLTPPLEAPAPAAANEVVYASDDDALEGEELFVEPEAATPRAPLVRSVISAPLSRATPAPASPAKGAKLAGPASPEASTMSSITPGALLLVDDDAELCRMFAQFFRRLGYTVTTAADGVAGFDAAINGDFALIIADLNMPKLDGWGLLTALREDHRTREVPFALLSCQDDYREQLRALDAGAQAYFPKTLRLDALAEAVKKLLMPRAQARAAMAAGKVSTFAVGTLGLGWVLRELAAHGMTGRLRGRDSWASYEVHFRKGAGVHAQAQTGGHQAVGERALNAFVASRCIEATWTAGDTAPRQTLMLPVGQLLDRAAGLLNENAQKLRDAHLVNPGSINVNADLYRVYSQNGPKPWLETARLLCEERLTPREVLSRLDESPIEVEETLRDLVRRGVVSLGGASAAA